MFIFVVDTEQYSGNFERDLCGYITGTVGDCEVGDDMAAIFKEETGYVDESPFHVAQVPDEHGCCRPCKIWPTPGWFNNGMGGHYQEGQDQENQALEDRNKRYQEEAEKNPKAGWNERCQNPLTKHPAYLSVAIFFMEKPSDDLIEMMIDRAKEFASKLPTKFFKGPFTITGFRLLHKEEPIFTELKSYDA